MRARPCFDDPQQAERISEPADDRSSLAAAVQHGPICDAFLDAGICRGTQIERPVEGRGRGQVDLLQNLPWLVGTRLRAVPLSMPRLAGQQPNMFNELQAFSNASAPAR